MSTVPEVIVANHLSLPVVGLSVITDECNPNDLKPVEISDIMEAAALAEPNMVVLFTELIKRL